MERKEFQDFLHSQSLHIKGQVVLEDNRCWLQEVQILSSDSTKNLATAMYQKLGLNYPKFHKMDLLSKLGVLCAEWVLREEVLPFAKPYKVAMVFYNAKASLYNDKLYQKTLADVPSPALFVYTLPNIVMGEIAIRFGIKGENTFFIQPKINRRAMAEYSQILIQQGIADKVLCAYIDFEEESQLVEMYWIQSVEKKIIVE